MKSHSPNHLAVFVCLVLFYGLTANIASVFSDSFESAADGRGTLLLPTNGPAALDDTFGMFRPQSADLTLSFRTESAQPLQCGARIVSKFSRSNTAHTAAEAVSIRCRCASICGESDSPDCLASPKRFLLFRFLLI